MSTGNTFSNNNIQELLDDLKSQFDVITTTVHKSSSQQYYKGTPEKQIKLLENTLNQLKTLLRDQNLLGFPGDIKDVYNIIAKQKQINETLKQSINQSSISSTIISKSLASELPPIKR